MRSKGNGGNNGSSSSPCSLLLQVQSGNDIKFQDFQSWCAFLSFANAFFAVLVILGNSVVFAAFYRFESLRTASNFLLLGLSFCDFFVGLVTQPLLATEIGLAATNSEIACTFKDLYVIFLFAFNSSSMVHICLITIERSVAIFYPFKHQRWITKMKIVILLVLFWISWALITVFTRRNHGGGIIGYSRMAFVIFSATFVVTINLRLWIEARKHSMRIHNALPLTSFSNVTNSTEGSRESRNSVAKAARDSKAAKTILLITGILILCNLPIIATFVTRKFYNVRGRVVTLLWFASNTIVLLPSFVNPLVYCWRRRDIRVSVKRMFGCRNVVGVQR